MCMCVCVSSRVRRTFGFRQTIFHPTKGGLPEGKRPCYTHGTSMSAAERVASKHSIDKPGVHVGLPNWINRSFPDFLGSDFPGSHRLEANPHCHRLPELPDDRGWGHVGWFCSRGRCSPLGSSTQRPDSNAPNFHPPSDLSGLLLTFWGLNS